MADNDIDLMAHLMRRAGFGAARDELEARVAKGYEATVEELLQPEAQPDVDLDLMERHMPEYAELNYQNENRMLWVFRMANSERPLQEKMALFWHGIHCTGYSKSDSAAMNMQQINMFREHGLGSFGNLLLELSRHPAMVQYLDNIDNHRDSVNENYGRELLEPLLTGRGHGRRVQLLRGRRKGCIPGFYRAGPSGPLYPYSRMDRSGGSTGTTPLTTTTEKRLSGRDRALERPGHSRHHHASAGHSQVRRTPPVQLLRRRRAPGPGLERHSAPGH